MVYLKRSRQGEKDFQRGILFLKKLSLLSSIIWTKARLINHPTIHHFIHRVVVVTRMDRL